MSASSWPGPGALARAAEGAPAGDTLAAPACTPDGLGLRVVVPVLLGVLLEVTSHMLHQERRLCRLKDSALGHRGHYWYPREAP